MTKIDDLTEFWKLFRDCFLSVFKNDPKNSVLQVAKFFSQAAQDSLPGFVNG